jgi:hypothetical protein
MVSPAAAPSGRAARPGVEKPPRNDLWLEFWEGEPAVGMVSRIWTMVVGLLEADMAKSAARTITRLLVMIALWLLFFECMAFLMGGNLEWH